MDNALSPARKASWEETATVIAGVSAPLFMSVADLVTLRQAGVVADILGFLGGVLIVACVLPPLRTRNTFRRAILVVGTACVLYWVVSYWSHMAR